MTYIKPLDSLRAIAVILVIIAHWFPETHTLNIYTGIFNGVDIFFVLSGFLITRILLENRDPNMLAGFYIRRFLRIFPIYYLFIFVLYLIGPVSGTSIRETVVYFLTYTSNLYFFDVKHWDGMLSHLWSLSVEEQFYLLWPWLMLYVSRKFLPHVIMLAIAVGVASEYYLKDVLLGDIFTLSCFDGFGVGALIAWAVVYRPGLLSKYYLPIGCLAVAALAMQIWRASGHAPVFIPSRTLTALCTAWVIIFILRDRRFILTDLVFNSRPLIFIGKISYGIYLYHLMIPYLTYSALHRLNGYLPPVVNKYNFYLVRVENFILLIGLAWVSWVMIERPFLTLKKHFSYQAGAPAAAAS